MSVYVGTRVQGPMHDAFKRSCKQRRWTMEEGLKKAIALFTEKYPSTQTKTVTVTIPALMSEKELKDIVYGTHKANGHTDVEPMKKWGMRKGPYGRWIPVSQYNAWREKISKAMKKQTVMVPPSA